MTNRSANSSAALAMLAATAAWILPGARSAEPAHPTPPVKAPAIAPEVGSYDIGLMLGSQLEHNGLLPLLSLDSVIRGLRESVGGRSITPAERDAALRFMRDARDMLAEKNRQAGRAFLARNAKEPGIVTMPSGLQYRILIPGDAKGRSPAPTDQVTVRYRASLADGTEFDRSDTHDRPATFRVNTVFKGWQEAFSAMKPGAKWQLFVPPELGYGNNSPPSVPPGALLVYELELMQIEPAAALDPTAAKGHPATTAAPAQAAPH